MMNHSDTFGIVDLLNEQSVSLKLHLMAGSPVEMRRYKKKHLFMVEDIRRRIRDEPR